MALNKKLMEGMTAGAVKVDFMEDKRTEQYRQELKEFVMSHTEDVLKNPRSFIRYPFIDPALFTMEMYGTGIPTGPYMAF